MSESLRNVWQEIENLLDHGINLIPVRDKDQLYKGKLYKAKTPYSEWTTYQYELIDRAILFDQMANKYDTTAVAMVCGSISGNLEVIDFDVKYYPGIDAVVLTAMQELYPDIFKKLRRHRTRGGGIHLVYRIADHDVPGSVHLAERPATQEELDADTSRNKRKTRCFIETRGTGALATAPPSLGYEVLNNIQVQTITWEERCTIIEFCKSYNEHFPNEKPYTPPKSEINYYDENPFEHYNRTVDPVELFTSFGWTLVRKHGDYIWFTRPGGHRNEVHAGFNTVKCTYRVWGTKADLDSERSYTPSTILAHYSFNGDKSATYTYLVQQGYGRIKPSMERQIAQRKAASGQPMPANASATAVEEYNQLVEQAQTAHPHGIYWEDDEAGKIVISRYRWGVVTFAMGFRLHQDEIVQIVDSFIYRRDLRYFFDTMRNYIKIDNPNLYEEVYNSVQTFIEKHGKFESTQLEYLPTENVLNDTRTTCYKFYQNGYVEISAQGYALMDYTSLDGKLIWHEKIQPRNFIAFASDGNIGSGLYSDFLRRACDLDNNRAHIMRVIGYLAHDFKDESTGYIIVLTEQCEDPDQGGGTGKNLFCNLLSLTTSYKSVAGSQIQFNEKFLQSWNGQRLFCISDAEENFDFMFLKDLSTNGVLVKKLWKDDKTHDPQDAPKFIIGTNYSYEIKDGGLKRRIIHIEFTDFFTVNGGIKKYYGKMFPHGWDESDYADYDNFICKSVQLWLASDCELQRTELSDTGWEKQFTINFGKVISGFINEVWDEFKKGKFISNEEFTKLLDNWLAENGQQRFKPSTFKLNKALDEWAKKHKYLMDKNAKENTGYGGQIRGRQFFDNSDPVPF